MNLKEDMVEEEVMIMTKTCTQKRTYLMIECLTCDTVDLAGLPNAAHDKHSSKTSTAVTLIFSPAVAGTLDTLGWCDGTDSTLSAIHTYTHYVVIQS